MDFPEAFLHAKSKGNRVATITVKLAELVVIIAPHIYWEYMMNKRENPCGICGHRRYYMVHYYAIANCGKIWRTMILP